jgi:hypothetical protein
MALLLVAATVAPGSLDARTLAVEGPVGSRAFGGALRIANLLALVAVGDLALAGWTSVIGSVFLPLAARAAILRYWLFDLDRISSRTVAYGC